MAANPDEEFKVAYNLTETGAQSHYANGQGIREFFDKHSGFLSAEYNPEEVYVQTTYKQRTLDSALAQLEGLYGKPMSWPNVDSAYTLNTIPMMEDMVLHVDDDNCPRFDQL